MARKKSKRNNVDKGMCPIPEKSNKDEKSDDGCLQSRIGYSNNVNKLLSTQMLVLVKGPICSGKSYCAQEVAQARKLPMKTFQINDDIDSRTIFGSYSCTDVPGEFVWQPSLFSKCLKEECLILLKSFDAAHVDLVATILSLAETQSYRVQGEGICRVNEGCRIVASMSSESSLGPLRDYPYTVNLQPLTSEEHSQILSMRFANLAVIKEKLLTVFNDACEKIKYSCSKSDRQLNSSDLFRLCKRLNSLDDLSDNVRLLHEFLDVWVMHLANMELRVAVAQVIAQALSITEQQLAFVMNMRKPDIELQDKVVVIGRTRLTRQLERTKHTHSYGLTRGYSQLIEQIATCVAEDERREAVLLSGETGVGKTSVIQLLASYVGVPLKIVNMSQDSEYSDLIGGYKPVSLSNLVRPLADDYIRLFRKNFNVAKNQKFLDHVNSCLSSDDFETFLQLVSGSVKSSVNSKEAADFIKEWREIGDRAQRLSRCFEGGRKLPAVPFAYVQGIVSEAAEKGYWLLIDEINLASAECLDAIVQVLDTAIKVDRKFRLFACMNPATDVGKKYLPPPVRSKFTEFYVQDTSAMEELAIIVKNYLKDVDAARLKSILEFYTEVCAELPRKYSLRTLCRALALIADNAHGNPLRSLVIGLTISFTSNLNTEEQVKLSYMISKYFGKLPELKSPENSLNYKNKSYVVVEGSHIKRGAVDIQKDKKYIFTPSVRANLAFLASVVATGRFPVILEGETSAGKTSIIQHLAKISGNRIYRINNHEYTDVQEYLGNYAPNQEGRLEFMEGVLLRAVRNGDWIILDELNLAPPAVLEALNRLLDDNREIFVPELNLAIPAHPRFQLFATQNPVGSYAGRKRLSRAFQNRFVIIKYDHLPFHELPKIVQFRCGVSQSMAEKMVEVLGELKSRRSVSGIFSFSNGLMTLRDLFRWGNRAAMTQQEDSYDWRQTLADQGYFVLGSKCRSAEDERTVMKVLEKQLKRDIDVKALFSCQSKYLPKGVLERCQSSQIVLNYSMCRMLILLSEAWKCNEAVLLVGQTGTGKTTAAHILDQSLLSINCNERTETSDFLGSIRPSSNGLFQWNDGVVLKAMKEGRKLLIDEISLAPDSVLERLNSLLEPERSILPMDGVNCDVVKAAVDFQILATMNPGDDHGKKELSKALRNRFLEVWCPSEYSLSDTKLIIEKRISGANLKNELTQRVTNCFVLFLEYFTYDYGHLFRNAFTTRDLVCMAELFQNCVTAGIPIAESILHAVSANLFDAFGILPSRKSFDRDVVTQNCVLELCKILKSCGLDDYEPLNLMVPRQVSWAETCLQIGKFSIPYGQFPPNNFGCFSFDAPTPLRNAFKVARALVSSKPVMLEGSPGAGKSSLIVALAKATGNELVRLNLSEQTDLSDLFGSDVPVVSGDGKTSFAWKDGPVLAAIKSSSWILLDEMNLASQPVLEGLNSCFDFRKNLFVSQINKTFDIEQSKCRFFACQNPRSQGGDRKALPKSFLNRFTSIFVEEMTPADFFIVLRRHCGQYLTQEIIKNMVSVNEAISNHSIREGGPFEFNLRDLLRWASATKEFDVRFGFEMVYLRRLWKQEDVSAVREIFDRFFGVFNRFIYTVPLPLAMDQCVRFGTAQLDIITPESAVVETVKKKSFCLLASQLKVLQQLTACVRLNWLCLITGECNSGKRSIVEMLAMMSNRRLCTMRLTAETDAIELLGSYEQLSTSTAGAASKIQFKWQNSEFVEAYMSGRWILIEDVNCCSSAVLDCLNACLEDGGHLVVPGHSVDDGGIIEKHNDFRAFFTMDPKNGKLSRAMRNRSVEFFMGQESQWNRNPSDAVSVVFRQHQSALDNIGRHAVGWICSSSSVELLQCSAMVSSSDLNGGIVAGVNSSSPKLMLVQRPMISLNLQTKGKLSECLSNYYWKCWCEVARISSDPIPAFVFALLTSSSNKPQNFCELDERLMDVVEKHIHKYFSSSGIDDVHKLFQSRILSSVTSVRSCSIDFLGLLRSIRNSAVTERFVQMFPTDHSRVIQEKFSGVLKKYQMSAPFKSFEDCEFFIQNAVSLSSNSNGELPLEYSMMSFSNDFKEFAQILCVLCQAAASTGFNKQGQLAAFLKDIPWKNQDASEIFSMLELLNYRFDFHSCFKVDVLDFLTLPCYQTVIVNKFWSLHEFSAFPQMMPLNKLQESGAVLNYLRSALWTLTFLRRDIQAKKRLRLCELNYRFCSGEQKLSSTREVSSLIEFVTTSLLLLEAVTPPFGLVDPAQSDQVQSDYGKESLQYVDTYFSSLSNFLVLTTGGCDEILSEHEGNPVIHSLHSAKQETLNFLSKLSNPYDTTTFYRPPSATFKELVEFLNSFTDNLRHTLASLLQQNNSALNDFCSGARKISSNISLLPAQLSVFLQTCESFKQQLAKKFFGFVDVTTIYISALNVLLLGVNRVLLVLNSEIKNRQVFENHGLSKFSINLRDVSATSKILRQAISSNSSLSTHLQVEAVLCHLQNHCDIPSDLLQWIESKWRLWYRRYSKKKDSLYVLKARKIGDAEDNGQENTDPEELELRQYLPDFSRGDNLDRSGPVSCGDSELTAGQIMNIFHSLLGQSSTPTCHEHEKISYHSMMRILDRLECYEGLEDNSDLLDYFHLIYLRKAAKSLGGEASKSSAAVLNVYAEGEQKEYFRAMTAVLELKKYVVELHHEFPENAVLSELLDRIHSFCGVNVNAPLMKAATSLEKVLTQANEWQQMADRSRSIQPQMLALQEILLDWRRKEVICWSEIIYRMEKDFEETAVLSSWPIFETFETFANSTDDSQLVCNDEKIVLMVIEWIHSSTLVDFHARLKSAELLVRFLEIRVARDLEIARKFSVILILRIKSLIRHFKTFSGALSARLSKAKVDVEQQLKNFVDIFKYSDLNLWSIKQSTQKAHAQLFKIIKAFKENCQEPVEEFLLNVLPQLPLHFSIKSIVLPTISTSSKFDVVAERIRCILSRVIDHVELDRLRNESESFLSLLNQNVSYDGFNDEMKEKLQGRALFERQKKFAFLIRVAAEIGLSSRRGLQISSENLTSCSVTRVFVEENDMGHMIRFSAVARNVFLKKFAAAKINQQEHLQKQVPVHVLTHLKGISEYGLHWMVSASQLVVQKILGQSEYFGEISKGFRLVMKNCESYDFDYKKVAIDHSQNSNDLKNLAYWTDVLKQVILCCPQERCSSSFPGQLNDLALAIGSNPLALITKSSDEYDMLRQAIDSVEISLGRLKTVHRDCQPTKFGLSDAGEIMDYIHVCSAELSGISKLLLSISQYFPIECKEMNEVCLNWNSRIQTSQYTNGDFPLLDLPEQRIAAILLKVQQLVNNLCQVVDRDDSKKMKCLDSLREILQVFYRLDLEEAKSEFSQLLLQISSSMVKAKYETVKVAYELSSDLSAIMELATGWFSLFLQLFSSCYINFEAIGCRILTDGFVNPIPKIQEGQSENTKESNETADSNCGMGEGTGGEEDVSSQIENSGQIEGLKGDKSDEPNELDNETAEEGNQPLETEDDFAANLEDIDGKINDDDEEQEGYENEVEWDKGQVEEADEQQLDPKLWEEPSADETKETESAQDERRLDGEVDDTEGDGSKEEKSAKETPLQEPSIDKTKGVDDDPSNDVSNENDLESPADEESMEIDDGSETQNEEADQLMDDSAAIDDGENSREEDMPEKTEEPLVDGSQDRCSMEDDVQKDPDVSANDNEHNFAMDDGMGQGHSEKSGPENKRMGVGQTEEVEGGETSNEKRGMSSDGKNDDQADSKNEQEQSAVDRLVNENTSAKMEEDNVLGDGEEDDEGEALGYHQAISEQERYVVKNSTIEESSKTREMIHRRPKTSATDAANVKEFQGLLPSIEGGREQPLSFSRHNQLPENGVSMNFDHQLDYQSASQIEQLREKFTELDAGTSQDESSLELRWSLISESVSTLSSMLAENLRMIIEPTVASRLQGDYRSGKRLNVRRLIAYIASDYRKDRIWMRRTKKVKRNYQICIAVDDSASMQDNLMTEITCHGLCLIEKAFRQLEVGQLSICKFGKTVKVITEFSAEAGHLDGANLLSELTFKQDRTDLANLLAVTGDHFLQARQDSQVSDQMLIILSDGRGVMSDGLDRIRSSISRFIDEQVTVLFLIIDNGQKSIMDVKVAKFTADGRVLFESYMEKFPFPFFAIVNQVSMLPSTIAEAIRQWFEFTCR